jgi:hypothetical protein
LSVIVNVPTPSTSVAVAGRLAATSDEVMATSSVNPEVTTVSLASSALTVNVKAVPAVALVGTVTTRWVAGVVVLAATSIVALTPAVIEVVVVSVAVMV